MVSATEALSDRWAYPQPLSVLWIHSPYVVTMSCSLLTCHMTQITPVPLCLVTSGTASAVC